MPSDRHSQPNEHVTRYIAVAGIYLTGLAFYVGGLSHVGDVFHVSATVFLVVSLFKHYQDWKTVGVTQ